MRTRRDRATTHRPGVRGLRWAVVVLATVSCGQSRDGRIAAASFVAADLAPLAPEGYTPYLAPEWVVPPSREPIPGEGLRVLERASGLSVVPAHLLASRDSSIVLLYLIRPVVSRPDSIVVIGGWAALRGGDGGGGWGVEYDYSLDCREECRLTAARGVGEWN